MEILPVVVFGILVLFLLCCAFAMVEEHIRQRKEG